MRNVNEPQRIWMMARTNTKEWPGEGRSGDINKWTSVQMRMNDYMYWCDGRCVRQHRGVGEEGVRYAAVVLLSYQRW